MVINAITNNPNWIKSANLTIQILLNKHFENRQSYGTAVFLQDFSGLLIKKTANDSA
jgi:hypothetical protein